MENIDVVLASFLFGTAFGIAMASITWHRRIQKQIRRQQNIDEFIEQSIHDGKAQ